MTGGHGTSLVQLGGALVSGGGLGLVASWVRGHVRARRQHQRVWDVITGTPAAPGVPAQLSLVERLENVMSAIDELKTEVAGVRAKQTTADSGHTKWAEAFNRKLGALARRLGRVEGHLAIGGE